MITSSKTDLTKPPNAAVPAGSTPQYTAQLLDANKNNVPLSALLTLTLSLYTNGFPPAIVNLCNKANILNTGRGTVSATGFVAIGLLAGDTALISPVGGVELRSMVLDYTFGAPVQTGRHEIVFPLEQLSEP